MGDSTELLAPLMAAIHGTMIRCAPGRTVRDIFSLALDREVRVQGMLPAIVRNPLFVHMIESMDMLQSRMKAWEEEEKGNPRHAEVILDRTIGLLQKTATRNAVAAIQIARISGIGLPRKKGERVIVSPRDQIPRAIAAEEDCQDLSHPGAEQAFLAGYHYDLLAAAVSGKTTPKDVKDALEKSWKEGLKAARIATGIVGAVKSFEYHLDLYACALLVPIGKVLMASLFPKERGDKAWGAFVTQCEKLGDRRELAAWVMEHRRFPITHPELSALFVSIIGIFGKTERAVAFHRDPQRLLKADRGLYRLAGVIGAANTLAVLPPSALSQVQITALKDCGLKLESLPLIMKKIAGDRS